MTSTAFASALTAYNYMMAGNATVTLRSKKTQQRYTFKIRKPESKPEQKFDNDVYFVSLLSGPENTSDYTYMGMIKHNDFRLTKASRLNAASPSVAAFSWAWGKLIDTHQIPESLEIFHEGTCGRCGRKLTVPESIEAGIGPECAQKM